MTKAELRKQARARREAMSPEDCARRSRAIFDRVVDAPFYREARTVLAYMSFRNEVDTVALARRALDDGKRLCVPLTDPATLTMKVIAVTNLERGLSVKTFGLLEPTATGDNEIDPTSVDLVLVPGLLFDRSGHRLGFGAGYYDRFIAASRCRATVGLAYEWQVVEALPVDPWDMRLSRVVTERAIRETASAGPISLAPDEDTPTMSSVEF